jgi:hypothetical protein
MLLISFEENTRIIDTSSIHIIYAKIASDKNSNSDLIANHKDKASGYYHCSAPPARMAARSGEALNLPRDSARAVWRYPAVLMASLSPKGVGSCWRAGGHIW